MKPIWKSIFAVTAIPFRLIVTIFSGPSNDKGRLAGRYTRPDKMADMEPSADYMIG